MNLAHLCDYLPFTHKVWGGAEQAAFRLMKLLDEKGYRQVVFVSADNAFSKDAQPLSNGRIKFLRSLKSCGPLSRFLEKLYLAHLKEYWLSFDIVSFFHSLFYFLKTKTGILIVHNCRVLSLAPVLAASLLGIPVVYAVYDYWCLCPETMLIDFNNKRCRKFHGAHCLFCRGLHNSRRRHIYSLRKKLFDFVFARVSKFVVLSYASSRMFAEYGIKEEKIEVIRVLLPDEFYNNIPRDSRIEKYSILFVGWVQYRKGLHVVIEALKKVAREFPDFKLEVAGEMCSKGYEASIRGKISEYGLEENVRILGKKTLSEVEQLLKAAQAVVIPEQWENVSPLIMLEAMALGKTVIASNLGGIPEFIQDGVTGFLADPDNPDDFAEKIIRVFGDGQGFERIGLNARSRVIELCDKTEIYGKWEKLIRELV